MVKTKINQLAPYEKEEMSSEKQFKKELLELLKKE